MALDSKLAGPYLTLGDIAVARGQVADAIKHYQAYLANESDAARAAAVRERMLRLERDQNRNRPPKSSAGGSMGQ